MRQRSNPSEVRVLDEDHREKKKVNDYNVRLVFLDIVQWKAKS